jgi:hypothetical protein
VGEEGVARGPGEPEVEERVVEAEPAGPGQHGPLEQRRRDGSCGGAPRGRSAHRGREERRLDGRRRRPAEREGVGAGGEGGGVEVVGEHGDWRWGLNCSVCVVVCACGFSASVFIQCRRQCQVCHRVSQQCGKKQEKHTRNQRREKITVCPRIFVGEKSEI